MTFHEKCGFISYREIQGVWDVQEVQNDGWRDKAANKSCSVWWGGEYI